MLQIHNDPQKLLKGFKSFIFERITKKIWLHRMASNFFPIEWQLAMTKQILQIHICDPFFKKKKQKKEPHV